MPPSRARWAPLDRFALTTPKRERSVPDERNVFVAVRTESIRLLGRHWSSPMIDRPVAIAHATLIRI
jgi:hypothetical protein